MIESKGNVIQDELLEFGKSLSPSNQAPEGAEMLGNLVKHPEQVPQAGSSLLTSLWSGNPHLHKSL